MRTPAGRCSLSLLLGLMVAGSSPSGDDQAGRYAPQEWQSVSVTRFARSLAIGPGYVLVGSSGGVGIFDRSTERWQWPLTIGDGLRDRGFPEVSLDADGRFLVRTGPERGWVDPSDQRYTSAPWAAPGTPVRRPTLPSNLFAGPDYQYLSDGRVAGPAGLTAVISAWAAEEGAGLWLTTWGLGSGRADQRTRDLEMRPHGLWSADVRALAVAADRMVAGGYGDVNAPGGLTEWRPAIDRWRYALAGVDMGLASDRVSGLALDGEEVWAAVEGGVVRGRFGGRWRFWGRSQGLGDGRTTTLARGAGAVWVGLVDGAAVIQADTVRTVPLPFRGTVYDIAGGDEEVWLATEVGAWLYRGRWPEGRLARLEHPAGRLDGPVEAVGRSENEVWWAGSFGVVGYDARMGNWLEVPPVGPFLPGECNDVGVDATSVWVATDAGVWRYLRAAQEWHMYDEQDGLIDRRVWTVVCGRDAVWFGTAGGVTRFDWRLRVRIP